MSNTETKVVEGKTLSKREAFRLEPLLVLSTRNEKKPGSMAWDRFEGYFLLEGEVTVQDALDVGLRMDDIRHDSAHGFILVGEAAIEAHNASKPREATAADFGIEAPSDNAEAPEQGSETADEDPADEAPSADSEPAAPKRSRRRR